MVLTESRSRASSALDGHRGLVPGHFDELVHGIPNGKIIVDNKYVWCHGIRFHVERQLSDTVDMSENDLILIKILINESIITMLKTGVNREAIPVLAEPVII
jgi:hypothetical protein